MEFLERRPLFSGAFFFKINLSSQGQLFPVHRQNIDGK
jgi:hypothetical protein